MEKQTSSSSVAAWRVGWLRPAEGRGASERPRVVQRVVSSTQGVSQQLPVPTPAIASPGPQAAPRPRPRLSPA